MAKPKLSETARDKLCKEHNYLGQARTVFRIGHLQEAFASHQSETDTVGVIRQYVTIIEKGLTPPVNILAAVWEGFASYLAARGNQSLDYAFGLHSKQRVGHPLEHRAATEQRGLEIYYMWMLRHRARKDGKRLGLTRAAEITINDLKLSVSESALEKSYKAQKADITFDRAVEIVEELSAKKTGSTGKQ